MQYSDEGKAAILKGVSEFHKINRDWQSVTAMLYRLGIWDNEQYYQATELAHAAAEGLDSIKDRAEEQ